MPGGIHPSYTQGYYPRDNAYYLESDKVAVDRERFRDWMQRHVVDETPDIFAARVAKLGSST